jgi:citrate synthase
MRGMLGLVYETSKLHPLNGITYRGFDLFQIMEKCPKVEGGFEPIPEGVLWLLLTGDVPSESEIKEFREEIY